MRYVSDSYCPARSTSMPCMLQGKRLDYRTREDNKLRNVRMYLSHIMDISNDSLHMKTPRQTRWAAVCHVTGHTFLSIWHRGEGSLHQSRLAPGGAAAFWCTSQDTSRDRSLLGRRLAGRLLSDMHTRNRPQNGNVGRCQVSLPKTKDILD